MKSARDLEISCFETKIEVRLKWYDPSCLHLSNFSNLLKKQKTISYSDIYIRFRSIKQFWIELTFALGDVEASNLYITYEITPIWLLPTTLAKSLYEQLQYNMAMFMNRNIYSKWLDRKLQGSAVRSIVAMMDLPLPWEISMLVLHDPRKNSTIFSPTFK